MGIGLWIAVGVVGLFIAWRLNIRRHGVWVDPQEKRPTRLTFGKLVSCFLQDYTPRCQRQTSFRRRRG